MTPNDKSSPSPPHRFDTKSCQGSIFRFTLMNLPCIMLSLLFTVAYCSHWGKLDTGDKEEIVTPHLVDAFYAFVGNPNFQKQHIRCAFKNIASRMDPTQFEQVLSEISSKPAKEAETELMSALLKPIITILLQELPLKLQGLKDIPNFLDGFLLYEGDFCNFEWYELDRFILTMTIDGIAAIKYLALKIPHRGIQTYMNSMSADDIKSKLLEWRIIRRFTNAFTKAAWRIISLETIPTIINKLASPLADELSKQPNANSLLDSLNFNNNSLVSLAIAYRAFEDQIKEDPDSYLPCIRKIASIGNIGDCLHEMDSKKLDRLLPADRARFYKAYRIRDGEFYSNFEDLLKGFKNLPPRKHIDALFEKIVSQEFPIYRYLLGSRRNNQQATELRKNSCLEKEENVCEASLREFVRDDIRRRWKEQAILEICRQVDPAKLPNKDHLLSMLNELGENSILQILENAKDHTVILLKLLEFYRSFPSLNFLADKGGFYYSVKRALANNCPLSDPLERKIAKKIIPLLSYFDLRDTLVNAFGHTDIYAKLTFIPRTSRIRYILEAYQDKFEHFYSTLQPPYEHLKAIIGDSGVCADGQSLSVCLEQLKVTCQNIKPEPRERYPLNYSQLIRKLSPHIKWDGQHTRDGDIYVRPGKLFVAADYFNLEDGGDSDSFFILIWQHVPFPNKRITSHTFTLEGGPGGSGDPLARDNCVRSLKPDGQNHAFYRIDHRGCGESGFKHLEKWRTTLASFIDFESPHNGLSPRHLTIYNAAMDLGMLAEAIRAGYGYDQRIILDGFSYGSSWAYVAAILFPRMFDAAILSGIPFYTPFLGFKSFPDLESLIELCSETPVCAKMFQAAAAAPVPEESLHDFIRDKVEKGMEELLRPSNKCGEHFNNTVMFQYPKRNINDSELELKSKLKDIEALFQNYTDPTGQLSQVRGASLLSLALIAGSAICSDFELYKKILSSTLEKGLRPLEPLVSPKGASFNGFVNWVINVSMVDKEQFQNAQHSNLLPGISHYYLVSLYDYFGDKLIIPSEKLKQHGVPSLVSDTIIIAVVVSKQDLATPPPAGLKLFGDIKPKEKYLLQLRYYGHDGYINGCTEMVRESLINGKGISQDEIDRCVQGVNNIPFSYWDPESFPGILREFPELLRRKRDEEELIIDLIDD